MTEAAKQYDNTNTGALFQYSDKEMRGMWESSEGVHNLIARYGSEGGLELEVRASRDDDTVIGSGHLGANVTQNPSAPNGRGSITIDGDTVNIVAWVKEKDGKNYYQLQADSFERTGGVFLPL